MSADTKLDVALTVLQPTARLILSSKPQDFEDATYSGFPDILDNAMREVVVAYQGDNSFIRAVAAKPQWTLRQSRAVANILRRHLRGDLRPPGTTQVSPSVKERCYTCGAEFDTFAAVMDHKRIVHGGGLPAPSGPASPGPTQIPVLPDFTPVHNINLREFPAGRFAVKDSTGTLRFFIITRLKRRSLLRGRFVWTKYRYAHQYLEAGTLTVREQAGDTKKLIGLQKIGEDAYCGEFEELIKLISSNPGEAMKTYGREKGACAYCGRSLTDEDSRRLGIGPDCYENKHMVWLGHKR